MFEFGYGYLGVSCGRILQTKQSFGAAEPDMTQTSGKFAQNPRFGCTLGLVHGYWHIPWDSGGYIFFVKCMFRSICTSACSPGHQLHVGMFIIEIQ